MKAILVHQLGFLNFLKPNKNTIHLPKDLKNTPRKLFCFKFKITQIEILKNIHVNIWLSLKRQVTGTIICQDIFARFLFSKLLTFRVAVPPPPPPLPAPHPGLNKVNTVPA